MGLDSQSLWHLGCSAYPHHHRRCCYGSIYSYHWSPQGQFWVRYAPINCSLYLWVLKIQDLSFLLSPFLFLFFFSRNVSWFAYRFPILYSNWILIWIQLINKLNSHIQGEKNTQFILFTVLYLYYLYLIFQMSITKEMVRCIFLTLISPI